MALRLISLRSPTFAMLWLIIFLRLKCLTLPEFHKHVCLGEGCRDVIHLVPLQLPLCPWLESLHEVEQHVIRVHVVDLEHEFREFIDIFRDRPRVLRLPHLLASLIRHIPQIELPLELALQQVPYVDDARPADNLRMLPLPPNGRVLLKVPGHNVYLLLLTLDVGGFEIPLHGPQEVLDLLGIPLAPVPPWPRNLNPHWRCGIGVEHPAGHRLLAKCLIRLSLFKARVKLLHLIP
ncbi:hypothetical protein CISIN_1g026714mg [Citrus sinensis]|uniref:Secreted protein n=1 Tax=Citrus sinensis TaxID=2711 RepID=A0A067EKY4_CITSI|nr:hypothetical protein CISIN_1g026714mg [Citrus sinensis]